MNAESIPNFRDFRQLFLYRDAQGYKQTSTKSAHYTCIWIELLALRKTWDMWDTDMRQMRVIKFVIMDMSHDVKQNKCVSGYSYPAI